MRSRINKKAGFSPISAVLIVGVLFIISLQFFRVNAVNPYQKQSLPLTTSTSTTPTSIIPTTNTASSTEAGQQTPTKIVTTGTISKKLSSAVDKIVSEVIQSAPPSPAPASISASLAPNPLLNLSDLNMADRQALVNIFCVTNNDGGLRPITGSGMMIDDRGVILTNAHIGQYLLLQSALPKGTVTCTIRTGSPAKALYRANLLYLSPNWIRNNSKTITQSNPTGTGEDDFSLLYITSSVTPDTKLPEHFPVVAIDTSDALITPGEQVLALGYPAGFLGGITISQELYSVASVATVGDVYTFKKDTFDLFSLGGTPVAQKGSSGGGIINPTNGRLSGLIVTTSESDSTGERDLRAITLSHIDRSLQEQESEGINQYLQGDLASKSLSFYENKAIELAQILIDAITGRK